MGLNRTFNGNFKRTPLKLMVNPSREWNDCLEKGFKHDGT
jgi:hypothetical protein